MKLLPPPTDATYSTLDEGQNAVQKWAIPQGYVVVCKKSTEGKQPRRWLICDRGGKTRIIVKEHNRKKDAGPLKKTNCPFECIVSCSKGDRFKLRIRNGTHNHPPLPVPDLLSARVALLKKHISYIANVTAAGVKPQQIINGLLLMNPSMMLKERDLYNLKARIRKANLKGQRPLPLLLLELMEDDDYYSEPLLDENDKIIGLFFCHKSSQDLLRSNSQVLIMDCTYKTNKFCMPLFDIIGIDCLQHTFYAGFCFLAREDQEIYKWALTCL